MTTPSVRPSAALRIGVTLLVVVGGLSLATTARSLEWRSFASALAGVSVPLLGVAILVSTVQVFFQLARFAILIPAEYTPPTWELLDATAVGQLLNYATPFRSGDAYKLLRLFPDHAADRERFSVIINALLIERVADIAALFLLAVWASYADLRVLFLGMLPRTLTLGVCAAAVTSVVAVAALAVAVRRLAALRGFLRGTLSVLWSPRFPLGLLVALATWCLDAGTLWFTARSLDQMLGFRGAMEAVFVLNLGIAVPVTVGNLGVFEASLGFGLSRSGIALPRALAIATAEHAVKFAGLVVAVLVLRLWWVLGLAAARRSPRQSGNAGLPLI